MLVVRGLLASTRPEVAEIGARVGRDAACPTPATTTKPQRDEARARLLGHRFAAVEGEAELQPEPSE